MSVYCPTQALLRGIHRSIGDSLERREIYLRAGSAHDAIAEAKSLEHFAAALAGAAAACEHHAYPPSKFTPPKPE